MSHLRWATAALVTTTAAVIALALTSPAGAHGYDIPRAELARVRAATAEYHSVAAAEADGYTLLDVCFDDPNDGGMGYHYLKGVDETLDPTAPEALVYEPTPQGLKLVAVEYIVPMDLSHTAPVVLGQPLHENPALHLWVLHAWIWQPNPAGMFEDYNPNVAACP
jgi:hypothetical protein